MALMQAERPVCKLSSPRECVDEIIRRVGKTIVFGMPLALGKSYAIANEMYARAKEDPEIDLTILTALSLEKPVPGSELERRILGPVRERIWPEVPDFQYMLDLRSGDLPENVRIREFFCKAGGYIGCSEAQQEYVSSNYTHVVRDLAVNGVNVYCHIVASERIDGVRMYSDSCNADLSMQVNLFKRKIEGEGGIFLHIGHVNNALPFMFGDAVRPESDFDILVESETLHQPLFSVPKASVGLADHMIGLNVSALIPDGGTLQIGIGSLGDAIASSLILRHNDNATWRKMIADSGIDGQSGGLIDAIGGRDPFEEGVYGATEMLVEVFLALHEAGILKRRVYGNLALQQAVNEGRITEVLSWKNVTSLLTVEHFGPILQEDDFKQLQHHGIFRRDLRWEDWQLVDGQGTWSLDLRDREAVREMVTACRGERLENGVVLHGGFFIGSNGFYDTLRTLPEETRKLFEMTGVDVVNQLYGDEPLRALQRKKARFVNTGMMTTTLGNICSDALEDGTVVSGVGGQYNFVSMAHALPDARLVMMVKSTGFRKGKVASNIRTKYGHTTIPRHLRDILVTEYGIADLRGRSDREVIERTLAITDSRFQQALADGAIRAGKLPSTFRLPDAFRKNTPERLAEFARSFRKEGAFPAFPFGTEFTEEEIVLGRSLRRFKEKVATNKAGTLLGVLASLFGKGPASARPYLERMQLDRPQGMKERLLRAVVTRALGMDAAGT